ncbi:MAG: helix-turn-helix domain-containing protein [Acidimicrobiales bacterium]
MPRITAPTVAEHVRLQERAILDAAGRLFAERGVSGTDLGDIAAEVGLARSSLYRYFPDKDHILLAWFERELQPVIDQSATLLEGDDPPVERIVRWMRFQIDYVADPSHDLAPRLAAEIGAVSQEVQHAIAAGHMRLYGQPAALVAEAVPPGRDARLVLGVLGGILRATGEAVAAGTPLALARAELDRDVRAVLAP